MLSLTQNYNTMVEYIPDQFKSMNELMGKIDGFIKNNTIDDFITIFNPDEIKTEIERMDKKVEGIKKVVEYFVTRIFPDADI